MIRHNDQKNIKKTFKFFYSNTTLILKIKKCSFLWYSF